jgi:hypothetical protein
MTEIQHAVQVEGSKVNTYASKQVIEAMYPSLHEPTEMYEVSLGEKLRLFNGALRFVSDGENIGILGNTVTRLCPVAADCGNCALQGSGLTLAERFEMNCARANTAVTFERANVQPEDRFVLLPTSKNSYVVDESRYEAEEADGSLLQNRLTAASSVVFTKTWLQANEHNALSVGMNGADGSMGVAITAIQGEELFMPFCSMRTNMGDRGEDDQILRQALQAYFRHNNFTEEATRDALENLSVRIVLSASASLKNFAHKIQIPTIGSKYDTELRSKYPELVSAAEGKVTPRIVLHDQYAGALERGAIYPEFEAQLGVQSDPYSPTACPSDGQTCHVDYRSETKYALVKQLKEMGVAEHRIEYIDEFALDPSSPDNLMASNRAEQNNGVQTNMTNRTLNGIVVKL